MTLSLPLPPWPPLFFFFLSGYLLSLDKPNLPSSAGLSRWSLFPCFLYPGSNKVSR